MFPVIIELWGFPVHTYGLLMGIGFLAGLFTATTLGAARKLEKNDIGDLSLLALIAGLVGGRLLFVAVEWDQFENDLKSIVMRRDGFVFYGGLILAVPAALVFIKRRKMNLRDTADVMAPALALAHSIGRLGCFAQGCCYGGPSEWGLLFDPSAPPSLAFGDTPVHPTQLYESLLLFALFLWLFRRFYHSKFPGEVMIQYALGYAVIRFSLEYLRADDRGYYAFDGRLSVSQIVSIVLFTAGAGCLIAWRKKADSK